MASKWLLPVGIALQALNVSGGFVWRLYYDGIPEDSTTVESIREFPLFPSSPTFSESLTQLEGVNNDGDYFGTWIRGYIQAPETGEFTFFISSDDGGEFWLSSNSSAGNKALIAQETACCAPLFSGARLEERSGTATLEKGSSYYFEIFHKENTGGSSIIAGWRTPSGVEEIIPGRSLMPFPDAGVSGGGQSTGGALTTMAPVISKNLETQDAFVGQSALFVVDAVASQPATFEWTKNGSPIDGANLAFLELNDLTLEDDGASIVVKITNGQGQATSIPATLNVAPDTFAPEPIYARTFGALDGIEVGFNEPVTSASAGAAANYSLSGGVTVTGVEVVAANRVHLATSAMQYNVSYTLTVSGIVDLADNPNTLGSASLPLNTAQGVITRNEFLRIGNSLDDLFASDKWPDQPDNTDYFRFLDTAENLGFSAVQFAGFLHPEKTGNYSFLSSSRDGSIVYLSSDENPDNKSEIIQGGGTDVPRTNYIESQTPVFLEAGETYYIEAVVQNTWNNLHLSVQWKAEDWIEPEMLSFANLSSMTPSGPLAVVTSPVSQTVEETQDVELAVEVSGTPPYTFQWYRNDVAIDGASEQTLSLKSVPFSENGSEFHVEVNNVSGIAAISDKATLTVLEKVGPAGPNVVSAAQITPGKVGIRFDRQLDSATASNADNYGIYGEGVDVTVTQAVVRPNGLGVELTLSQAVTLPDLFTVFVDGVRDTAGVTMEEPALMFGAVLAMGATDMGGPAQAGSTFAGGPGYLEVTAGGKGTWANDDQFHYTYAQVSGDFDVSVRISDIVRNNAGGSPKLALMARSSLDQGADNVSLNLVPGGERVEINMNESTSGDLEFGQTVSADTSVANELRMTRSGQMITCYFKSGTDLNWTELGSRELATFPESLYVGFNTNADTDQAGSSVSATYSGFTLSGASNGYMATDIDNPLQPGKTDFGFTPGDLYVEAGGKGSWANDDQIHFTYKPKQGDFDVSVEVADYSMIEAGGSPKLALMVRTGLEKGADNVSLNFVPPGNRIEINMNEDGSGDLEFGQTISVDPNPPIQLRLTRTGQTITCYWRKSETDNWSLVGQRVFSAWPNEVLVGINTNADKDAAGSKVAVHYTKFDLPKSLLTLPDMGLSVIDLDNPAQPGVVTTPGGFGDFDVVAGGKGTWANDDQFNFVYGERNGDFDVSLTIADYSATNSGGSPKAALMVRTGLEKGADNVSLNFVPPGNRIEINMNESTSGDLEFGQTVTVDPDPPIQLRMTREGDLITCFWRKTDDQDWADIGSRSFPTWPAAVFIGSNTNADVDAAGSTLAVSYRNFGDTMDAVFTPNSPLLNIATDGTEIVLRWAPQAGAAFAVEATDSLQPPFTWQAINAAATEVNGMMEARLPLAGATKLYYRLRSL